MRPVTGARNGRTTSPHGTRCSSTGSGTPEDELLDRLTASPALAGPELIFLRARIAERRGDVSQAAALVTRCLKEMPGRQEYLHFAFKVGAELPSRAREISAERVRVAKQAGTTRPDLCRLTALPGPDRTQVVSLS